MDAAEYEHAVLGPGEVRVKDSERVVAEAAAEESSMPEISRFFGIIIAMY